MGVLRAVFSCLLVIVSGCGQLNEVPETGGYFTVSIEGSYQERLLKELVEFSGSQEVRLLQQGRPLSSKEKMMARKIGVQRVDLIRVLVSRKLPRFEGEYLTPWASRYHFNARSTSALTFGYGIIVRRNYAGNKPLLAHEFVHVQQMEELGLENYLKRYIAELNEYGYKSAPLEVAARVYEKSYR